MLWLNTLPTYNNSNEEKGLNENSEYCVLLNTVIFMSNNYYVSGYFNFCKLRIWRNFVYTFKKNDSQAIFTVNLLSTKCQTCPLFYLHYSFSHRLTGVYWHMVWYKPEFGKTKKSKKWYNIVINNCHNI